MLIEAQAKAFEIQQPIIGLILITDKVKQVILLVFLLTPEHPDEDGDCDDHRQLGYFYA